MLILFTKISKFHHDNPQFLRHPIKFAIVDPSTAPDCTTKLTIKATGRIFAGAWSKHASELQNDKKKFFLGPDYIESFSPSCRCLTHVVKTLLKINLRLHRKFFSPNSRGEVPARSIQPGIPPNQAENFSYNRVQPGLKQ